MNIHEHSPARKIYLTDDENIIATCSVGVFRPECRVQWPLGISYYDLAAVERSVLWAFERVAQTELAGIDRTWIYRGLSDNEPTLEDIQNLFVMHVEVLDSPLFEPDYEDLVADERTVHHGWAHFVEVSEAWAEDYLAAACSQETMKIEGEHHGDLYTGICHQSWLRSSDEHLPRRGGAGLFGMHGATDWIDDPELSAEAWRLAPALAKAAIASPRKGPSTRTNAIRTPAAAATESRRRSGSARATSTSPRSVRRRTCRT